MTEKNYKKEKILFSDLKKQGKKEDSEKKTQRLQVGFQ